MKIGLLRIGMKVSHPSHGTGIVRGLSEIAAEVDFDSGRRTIAADDPSLHPAEPIVSVTGLDVPLPEYLRQTVGTVLRELGIEKQEGAVEGLGQRWRGGTLVLQPANDSQPKELPLETFFHKIVMVRNNLRVLEQKINASEKLEEAEKVELQQYITRSYGSMTTFNVLFREKEDQF